jgi:integrase
MSIYKRWKGRKITPEHQHWKEARWTTEFVLKGRRVIQAIPEARTQAEAVRAETKIREDVYHRRYGGVVDVGFTDFFENIYLPWLKDHHPASYRDGVSRGKLLKEFFATQKLQDITTKECERLKLFLKRGDTPRGKPRSGTTINRYVYLLSAVLSRAILEERLNSNPCIRIKDEPEKGRERYLTPHEHVKLRAVLKGDLEYLRLPIEVSLGTGMRKRIELLRLKGEHLNFGVRPVFFPIRGGDVEVPPGWLIVVEGKGSKYRLIPMNSVVRAALLEATQRRSPDGLVFDVKHNGVNEHWLKRGFEEACTRAGIVYGETKPGGIIWHDLRRTFATRLRANGVHEYDIQDLMGHAKPGVTKVYARATLTVLEEAVAKLTEPWGEVLRFERKAS